MKVLILCLVLFLKLNPAWAVTNLAQEAWIVDPDHLHLKALSAQPELVIDHVSRLGYEVYGPSGLLKYLDQQGVEYTVQKDSDSKRENAYPSPEESLKSVLALAKKYPTLVELTEIGKSGEGRSLTFARVTSPDQKGNPISQRPEFKYIANMHGDEIVGREMMIKLIEDLASNYGKDPRITRLLDGVQIYILPSMNPDGAAHKTRYNAKGTDLNRSFPDFTTSDNQNTAQGRDPEIQAIMAFQAAHHFKLSANFHGGSQVVNYPWDTEANPFPLDNLVKKLSLDYSKNVPYLYQSTEFKQGITNGYAWYEVDGGMQDWSYNWYKDLQLTIEVTNVKWPAYKTVSATYAANREALITLIEDINQF